MTLPSDPVIVDSPMDSELLKQLVAAHFEDMVEFVADVELRILAVGGELHAEGEGLLIENGSRLPDLWGVNYYPGRGPDECIEFTSLIDIRPAQDNRSMVVQDESIRARMREIVHSLMGRGEPLP